LLVLPVFYIKILFVILSVIVLLKLQQGVATEVNYADADLSQKKLRILSVMCLATWMIALIAGRLTAYPMLLFGH
jgi:ABC-type sulfate transport system permease component